MEQVKRAVCNDPLHFISCPPTIFKNVPADIPPSAGSCNRRTYFSKFLPILLVRVKFLIQILPVQLPGTIPHSMFLADNRDALLPYKGIFPMLTYTFLFAKPHA